MRIERKGKVPKVTPRLERFFVGALGGRSLDDPDNAETRRPDYVCLRGLLAIEIKTLKEDASGRMDHFTEELRERPDWPVFLGSAPMEAFLKHIEGPEEVRRQLQDRLARAIKNHTHKANKQLAAHTRASSRRNLVRLLVMVNEDHGVYEPNVVGYILHHLLTRKNADGVLLYDHIDAAMYFSERHAAVVNGHVSFPILCVESASLDTMPWKGAVLDHVIAAWAKWNGTPLYNRSFGDAKAFETISHIPEQMRRQEKWELDYRRNPHMRGFTKEQLRKRFDEMNCVATLAFLKASPFNPPAEMIEWSMATMSQMMIEMGERAIPATDFALVSERLAEAARRMNLPTHAVEWLRNSDKPEA